MAGRVEEMLLMLLRTSDCMVKGIKMSCAAEEGKALGNLSLPI